MIAKLVYLLCALTSILCAGLLLRNHAKSGARLLFWSGLCFVFLGISNVLLFVDLVLVPEIDLAGYRTGATLIGIGMLLYGLIWEAS